MREPDFKKSADGLLPTVVQDSNTGVILMLGYMNEASLQKTKELGKVTFFSRSKSRLWTKGEESGNYLLFKDVLIDCDNDTLLIKATPTGPVCHTGTDTCFEEKNSTPYPRSSDDGGTEDFLVTLEHTIEDRFKNPSESSYVSKLQRKGINKIAQKVGEEATELIIEAKDNNDDLFLNEAADLLFHMIILLKAKNYSLDDVKKVLQARHKKD